MKAIQIEAFGNPAEAVKAVDIPDVGAPAAAEVVIAVEASPINQYDLFDDRRRLWLSATAAGHHGLLHASSSPRSAAGCRRQSTASSQSTGRLS
jgi:hypothetical protein